MKKILQNLHLELEAIYHTNMKFVTLVAISIISVLSFSLLATGNTLNNLHQSGDDENSSDLNYSIAIERTGISQEFLATNNEIEQIYGNTLSSEQNSMGEAVAVANDNLMAVSSISKDDLLIVHILEKSNKQWQETYSFSYEATSSTNYEIPHSERPHDTDDLLFGSSLAFHGNNLLAIGAPSWQGPAIEDDTSTTDIYEGDNGGNRGAVYVFQYSNNTWSLVSTIRGTEPKGKFGSAVSFSPSGELAVGAKSNTAFYNDCPKYYSDTEYTIPANEDTDNDGDVDEDDTTTTYYISAVCPAVYLYERDSGQGVAQWNKTDTIRVTRDEVSFGNSVAFGDDNLLAIGAVLQYAPNRVSGEGYTRRVGAVHLYTKDNNGDWSEKLVISDFNTNNPGVGKYQIELEDLDYFGQAVGFIDPSTLVASINYTGVLLVFEESGSSWSKTAEIKGHELLAGNQLSTNNNNRAHAFGYAISTYNNLIVATQPKDHYAEKADLSTTRGVVNLLKWTTFQSGTTWHYVYINDNNCSADDFSSSPTSYTEGDSITPPSDKEGFRLCFKADNGTSQEYFASLQVIDITSPEFANPALDVSKDGVLSIYFNEQVRKLDDTEIDEDWVQTNVDSLQITPDGQSSATSVSLNHDGSSTLNNGNSLISIEHIAGKTILKLQLDTADTNNFPLSSDPSSTTPHEYSITMYNLEDFSDNAQTSLTAEQEIEEYVSSTPSITITDGSDQSIIVTDSLGSNESTLTYVWQSQEDACDSTTDFNSAYSYIEGVSIRLEEAHNGRQICFRSINNEDTSLKSYKAYDVNGVDRSAPTLTVTMTTTAISAGDDDETNTWSYVVIDSKTCDSSVDFTSATTYTEDTELTIDTSDTSTEANKYYCFKAVDSQDNAGYGVSSQIAGSPKIKKITVSGQGQDLFGIGRELVVFIHFDEPVVLNTSQRSVYLSLNSQTEPNSLNALRPGSHDLANGIVGFYYITQIGDSTDNLQVLEIVTNNNSGIQDADGNDAILDVSNLVIVGRGDQPRTIVIDGFKPTITLTAPDLSTLETTKKISGVDDDADNDDTWDYYFFNHEQLSNNFQPAEIGCYLGDFLSGGYGNGTPYHEGDEIILTEENNNQYICIRSRRAKQELWDRANDRDRAEAVSSLITNIDSTPPVITTRISGKTLTVNVNDVNEIDSTSLIYKLIDAEAECDETALASGTSTYANGDTITIEESFYGSRFCFTAADVIDNTSWEKSDIFVKPTRRRTADRTPPNIIITNPDDSTPETTKIISATTDSSDADEDSWRWKAFDPDQDDCNSDLMNTGINIYDAGEEIVLDSEIYNNQKICFGVSDNDDNTAYDSTSVITSIDRTTPSIVITIDGDQISAVDNDDEQTEWRHLIVDENTPCNVGTMSDSQVYQEGSIISLAAYPNNKVCFKVQDAAGNTGYRDSAAFAIIQEIEGLNLEISQDDTDEPEIDNRNNDQSPEPEDRPEDRPEDNSQEDTDGEENDGASSFNPWIILLGLLVLLIIIFIIAKRRKDDEE